MAGDPRVISLIMALRKLGITDTRVLSAIETTPREMFVAEPFRSAAYDNTALPIACGQTISQPQMVAVASEALELGPNLRVLEIGCGSGYQAAVLSRLCRRVYTMERHKALLREAEDRFKKLKLENITTWHGDGFKGWPEQAPFDRILLSAAVPQVPETLIEQLKVGGILVAPVGERVNSDSQSVSQHLTKMIRSETEIVTQTLMPVVYVPMVAGLPEKNANSR